MPSAGLGLEEGWAAMCARDRHHGEPADSLGKTMTGEMKGFPDKGVWPSSVYL